jgi:hypothetical protein
VVLELYQLLHSLLAELHLSLGLLLPFREEGMPPVVELVVVQVKVYEIFPLQVGQLLLGVYALLQVSLLRVNVVFVVVVFPSRHPRHTHRFLHSETTLEILHELYTRRFSTFGLFGAFEDIGIVGVLYT